MFTDEKSKTTGRENNMNNADDRLIVALDFPSRAKAEQLVEKLGDKISFYKIGHQMVYGAEGMELGRQLIKNGKKVFFDLKLLDIDNTVAKAVEAIAKTGASMLTIHAYPRAMAAAVKAAKGSELSLLAVSVLTSMDEDDLMQAGYDRDVESLVGLRAYQAKEAGMGGVVCSAFEAALVKKMLGDHMAVVTPGIRLKSEETTDQKRVATPADAISWGASNLVVGRPITASVDPVAATYGILEEMLLADQAMKKAAKK